MKFEFDSPKREPKLLCGNEIWTDGPTDDITTYPPIFHARWDEKLFRRFDSSRAAFLRTKRVIVHKLKGTTKGLFNNKRLVLSSCVCFIHVYLNIIYSNVHFQIDRCNCFFFFLFNHSLVIYHIIILVKSTVTTLCNKVTFIVDSVALVHIGAMCNKSVMCNNGHSNKQYGKLFLRNT